MLGSNLIRFYNDLLELNMRIRWFMHFTLTASLWGIVLWSSPSKAQNASVPFVNTLKNELAGMGYQPEVSGRHIRIDAGDFVINFNLSDNNNVVYIYSYFAVTDIQSKKAPLREMLDFNDSNDIYFSVHAENNAVTTVSLNETALARDITPALLRQKIDELNHFGHEQQALFDPANWK